MSDAKVSAVKFDVASADGFVGASGTIRILQDEVQMYMLLTGGMFLSGNYRAMLYENGAAVPSNVLRVNLPDAGAVNVDLSLRVFFEAYRTDDGDFEDIPGTAVRLRPVLYGYYDTWPDLTTPDQNYPGKSYVRLAVCELMPVHIETDFIDLHYWRVSRIYSCGSLTGTGGGAGFTVRGEQALFKVIALRGYDVNNQLVAATAGNGATLQPTWDYVRMADALADEE